jgi:two-component system, NarL family, sensor histidine kinase DegS
MNQTKADVENVPGELPLSLEQVTISIGQELDQSKQQIKEVRLLIEQSRSEVEKLKQRQASETMRLKQIQTAFDSIPREDIRKAYESTMDAQQRLFSMSGQIERLQAQQSMLEQRIGSLTKTYEALQIIQPNIETASAAPKSMVIRVIEAQEAERLKLSRLMHDGPAQVLSNFILQSEIAARLFDIDPIRAKEELANLKMAASSAFQRIRNFIFDLRPMMLDDLGLIPTLRRYLDATKEQGQQDINFLFTGSEKRLPNHLEVVLFRSIQQLVGLARDPIQASHVKVVVDMEEAKVRAVLDYDGKIIEMPKEGKQEDTYGLLALMERLKMLGGSFEYSAQIGQNTHIVMEVPLSE